jgi:2-amino-4-hydroxy-6-hydroxymethyldihydropteridine diphosphokinase
VKHQKTTEKFTHSNSVIFAPIMNRIILLTGSNIGDSLLNLEKAKNGIQQKIGDIAAESSIYITAAWGKTDQPDFLNQVLLIHSNHTATDVLQLILTIEQNMGRIRTEKNAPRTIDIDILFFNDDIIQTENLIVPHPLIAERRFVLEPLNELMSNEIHPVHQKKISQLLEECTDTLVVRKK